MNKIPSLAVPVMSDLFLKHSELYLERLKLSGARFVWLAPRREFNPEKIKNEYYILPQCIEILENAGYGVGVWIQAFGFGEPIAEHNIPFTEKYQKIKDMNGREFGDAFCPLDLNYSEYITENITSAIYAGAKIIMLDDDLCLNIRPGLGCTCERHISDFEKKLGYSTDRENMKHIIFTGETSRERKVWLQSQGDSLREFCRNMRNTVDKINPSVRLGFCAGYTSWDLEGADALELTKILAGQTKPFLRLTGAPYWAEINRFDGQSVAHIVEFTRMQLEWCKNSGVEVFYENDSYPRPVYKIPAAMLETFDFCLAAHGSRNQLKYLFDYHSRPDYEEGYLKAHIKNKRLIENTYNKLFELDDVGIYVHENMNKIEEMLLPDSFKSEYFVMHTAFSAAADLLSGLSIPITYCDDGGATVAFGNAGRTVPLNQRGYILDAISSTELKKRNIDTGLLGYSSAPLPEYEFYDLSGDVVQISDDDYVQGTSEFYEAELSENAVVESWFMLNDKKYPASYSYTNADGIKFLVFLFRADTVKYGGSLAKSYYRQSQILNALADMKSPAPAKVKKASGLWLLCKQDENTLAVAMCNFSSDEQINPVIELTERFQTAEFIGLTGVLTERKVSLEALPAYRFGVVILKK